MGGYTLLVALFFAAVIYLILLVVNTIIAPAGKRILVFLVTLIVLPAVTAGATLYLDDNFDTSFLNNFTSDTLNRDDVFSLAVSAVFVLFALASIAFAFYLRVAYQSNPNTQTIAAGNSFNGAKISAALIGLNLFFSIGRDIFISVGTNFMEMLASTHLGMISLAMMLLNAVACVGLWQHRDWSWWLAIALSIIPFGFLFFNGLDPFRSGMLPPSYLFTFIPSIVVIVVLLLPKTRELCEVEI